MPVIGDVLKAIERVAPERWAFGFDKVGLQVGHWSDSADSVCVALDWSNGLLQFAESVNANLLICHHPLLWNPIHRLVPDNRATDFAMELVRRKVGFVGCHTNWDAAPRGINDALVEKLGLSNVRSFGSAAEVENFKIVVFAPAESVERVIDAMAAAGAGKIGNYERCAYMSAGEGTFFGTEGANPSIGDVGRIELVAEKRIEMVCPVAVAAQVVQSMKRAHPYEEPAYDLVRLAPSQEQPAGRIGELPSAMNVREFQLWVETRLATRCWTWNGAKTKIETVAVVGGAADGEWAGAIKAGADAFVTGEVKQDRALDAASAGMTIMAAGHYATEQPGVDALKRRLEGLLPASKWHVYEPLPGEDGRPNVT